MKTHFRKQVCHRCGKNYDGIASHCPSCGEASTDSSLRGFSRFLPASWPREIALFLVGWAGFQGIALLISILYLLIYGLQNPSAGSAELTLLEKSIGYQATVNFASYGVLAVVLSLILWSGLKFALKSFATPRAPIVGVIGFAAAFAFSIVYSLLIQLAFPNLPVNSNQQTLNGLIKAFPALSFFIFGIVGPYCEELTYRVGLFSFLARLGKILAYILSGIFFGLIHFDWTCLGNSDALLVEALNLPSYIVAGVLLALAYDYGGFGASFMAHSLNNILSIILTMAEQTNA